MLVNEVFFCKHYFQRREGNAIERFDSTKIIAWTSSQRISRRISVERRRQAGFLNGSLEALKMQLNLEASWSSSFVHLQNLVFFVLDRITHHRMGMQEKRRFKRRPYCNISERIKWRFLANIKDYLWTPIIGSDMTTSLSQIEVMMYSRTYRSIYT